MQNQFYSADAGAYSLPLAHPDRKDFGHLPENIVFWKLKKRVWQVYVGKAKKNKLILFILMGIYNISEIASLRKPKNTANHCP
jgi:predicted AAA+ superfamily ATPase